METALLALLALGTNLSGMGVLFGWQPMPDGSDKVEYVVQIEPELAATLREGQSIPITSDIPDDIGPIGRIRIVVGRDDLPRQSLATRLKPWPEGTTAKKSREGLVETQFSVPATGSNGSGRYGNTSGNNTIMPPGGNNQGSANPFAKTLQQGKQDLQNAANNFKNEILPPSSDQLFGSSTGGSPGLQNAINNTKNQVSQGFRRNVEQVADRTGQQILQAANDLGQGANNAIDKFGQSVTGQQSIVNNRNNGNSRPISPPASNFAQQPSNSGPQLGQPQPQTPTIRQQAPPANFAANSQRGNNPTSQRGDWSAPWGDTASNPGSSNPVSTPPSNDVGYQQPPAQSPAWPKSPYQQPSTPPANQQDSFEFANQPNPTPRDYGQGGFNAVSTPPNPALEGNPFGGAAQQQQQPPLQQAPPAAADIAVQNRSGPAIRSGMISSPGNDMQPVGANQNFQPRQVAKQPLDTRPPALGWDEGTQQFSDSRSNFLPIAMMCVVLSGSVFGNFYLFWSYFDLRGKYQGLVHGTPLRRDRYDD